VDCERLYTVLMGWESNYWGGEERADSVLPIVPDEQTSPTLAGQCEKLRARYKGNDNELDCFRTGRPSNDGFWSRLVMPSLSSSEYTRWRLIYTDSAGRSVLGEAWPAGDGGDAAAPSNAAPTIPGVLAIADLDGDSRQEIVLGRSEWIDVGNHSASTVSAWSIKRRSIVELEATQKRRVIHFRHGGVEGLGPLQLVVDPYVTPLAPVGMTFATQGGWTRGNVLWSVLVTLDSAGEAHDAEPESVAYARELCPSPEGLLEGLRQGAQGNPECITGYVHCANLWGLPVAEVDGAIADYCTLPELQIPNGPCQNSSEWHAMLTHPLPIRLGATANPSGESAQ
jgi:hypothetical protein